MIKIPHDLMQRVRREARREGKRVDQSSTHIKA